MSNDDWLWDGSGSPDAEDKRISDALKGLAYDSDLADLPSQRPKRAPVRLPWTAIICAIAAGLLWALSPAPPPPEVVEPEQILASATPWGVEAVEGQPSCNNEPVDDDIVLDSGGWLNTAEHDEARLTIADLGFLDLAPNSSLRLVSSTPDEHRLELARGRVDLQVVAPPRALVIETPGGVVVDLGCAYTLETAENGYGSIEVRDGWVAVEHAAHNVLVPEGAAAKLRGPLGPTPPVFVDADPNLAEWATMVTSERDYDAFGDVLSHSRARDTLTLVHLFEHVGPVQRHQILDRMETLLGGLQTPREPVVQLDADALQALLTEASDQW